MDLAKDLCFDKEGLTENVSSAENTSQDPIQRDADLSQQPVETSLVDLAKDKGVMMNVSGERLYSQDNVMIWTLT